MAYNRQQAYKYNEKGSEKAATAGAVVKWIEVLSRLNPARLMGGNDVTEREDVNVLLSVAGPCEYYNGGFRGFYERDA
ncbi:hypothetical protein GCM10027217_02030 [Pseudomaricurvus hydrocarbonicus]